MSELLNMSGNHLMGLLWLTRYVTCTDTNGRLSRPARSFTILQYETSREVLTNQVVEHILRMSSSSDQSNGKSCVEVTGTEKVDKRLQLGERHGLFGF